ncbi:MAG: hypothetical protein KGM98_07895 [Bacteroidota bacterium]|nr:hypothetical protein [Bacteroidota bacterium]
MNQNGLRQAIPEDYQEIMHLIDQADQKNKIPLQWDRLESLLEDPTGSIMVYESQGRIVGLMTTHFLSPLIQYAGEYQEVSQD